MLLLFNLNNNLTNIILYIIGLLCVLLSSSIGIDIYNYVENRNLEDIDKDMFAYGWFIGVIVLSILLSISSIIVYYFIREFHWSWGLVLSIISIITSSFAWDLVTRTKELKKRVLINNAIIDRKLFMGITLLSFVLFFLSLNQIKM